MAKSIKELCMADVAIYLATITTANGYGVNIDSVERFSVSGNGTITDNYIILIQGDTKIIQDGPYPYVTKRIEIGLHVVVIQDTSTDARYADEVIESYEADIGKALSLDPKRSGFALDTSPLETSQIEVNVGQKKIEQLMVFSIDFRHLRSDPTVQ